MEKTMSRSQQVNLENAKVKVRNFSHMHPHNDILLNYEMIFWGAGQGKAGQGR